MSRVRIPRDPFPFFRHRTVADVMRTYALLFKPTLTALEARELEVLEAKAQRHNPPPAPADDGGRAA